MTAVITGPGLGLERNSGSLLGASGQLGSATLGLAGNQVYVNAATGNFVVRASDQYLMGLGPDISNARTYNSQGTLSENNGQLWSDDYGRHVLLSSLTGTVNTAGSTISRVTGDGAVVVYTYNGTAYVANEGGGAYDTMSFNTGSGLWKWTDGASQTVETYDSTGRLTSVTDHTGMNTLTLSYSSNSTTITTAASNGVTQNVTLYYNTLNGVNELASSYAVASDTTSYFASFTLYNYDSLNRLTSEVTELTPQYGTVSPSAHYDTTYGYQGSTNQLTSISQSDGSMLTIGYNGSGQVNAITQALGAGANTQLTFDYSTPGQTTVTDNGNNHTTFGYNSLGQLTSLLTPVGQTEAVTYNTMGDVWTITQNGVLRHTYTYDGAGNQLSDVDAMGDEIDRTYTSTNQLWTSTQYTRSGTSGTPLTTTYAYDAQNDLAFVVSPNNDVTQYLYSSSAPGVATTVLRYGGASMPPSTLTYSSLQSWTNSFPDWNDVARTEYTLDARGNVKQSTVDVSVHTGGAYTMVRPAFQTQYFVDYTGVTLSAHNLGQDQYGSTLSFQSWNKVNDGLGRLASATDTNGQTINYSYSDNGAGEVVIATNTVTGTVTTSTYNLADELLSTQVVAPNAPTATTTYAYNSLGQLRATTDPTGVSTYFVYDANGRKVADILGDGAITTYAYNADGLLAQTIVHDYKLSSSQLALLTTSGYSAPVPPASVLPVSPSSDPNSVNDLASYSFYDTDGRLTESIDAAGTITTYLYDGASRLMSTTVYASQIPAATLLTYKSSLPTAPVAYTASAGLDRTTTFTYDNDGRVTQSVVDSGGLNLKTFTTYDKFGNVVAVTDPEGNISCNIYNLAGQLTYKIDGAGDVTLYTYDTDNNLLSSHIYATPLASPPMITQLTTLSPQALIDLIAGEVQTSVSSAPNGWLPFDNIQTQNTYDSRGRLSNSLILGTETYDAAGNLIAVTDPDVLAANASGGITRYVYDGNGRRIYTINGAGDVTKTVYDAAGRIVQTIAYATPLSSYQLYNLNPTSMASSYTVASLAAQVTSFVSTSASKDEVTSNVYDGNGHLAFTIDAIGRATGYDYDAEGRVVQTTVYATPITQASGYSLGYVQGQVASHTADAANRVTRVNYNSAGQVAFSIDAAGGVTSFLYDAFGNVAQETLYSNPFNTAGIQTTVAMQAWAATNATASDNRTIRYAYDGANRLVFSIDAANYVTQTAYDGNGQVVATRQYTTALDLSGLTGLATILNISPTAKPSDHVNRTIYDGAGRAIYTIDAAGSVNRKVYDGDNKVLATVAYATPISQAVLTTSLPLKVLSSAMTSYTTPGTQDRITRYIYGDGGRLRVIIDAAGDISAMNYDNDGRLTSLFDYASTYYNGNISYINTYTPLVISYSSVSSIVGDYYNSADYYPYSQNEMISYTYDAAGRQITKTDALGYVTASQYDAFGNVVKITDPRGNSGFFYYNQLNQLTTQVDAIGYLTTTKYSIGGQVTEVTRGAQNYIGISVDYVPTPPPNPGDETTDIGRDKLDRIVSTTDAMGNTESYQLDIFGDRIRITNKLGGNTDNTFDGRGLLIGSNIHEASYAYEKDSSGNNYIIVQETDGDNTFVTNTYEYDAFGNRTVMKEAAGIFDQRTNTYNAGGLSDQRTTTYAYDGMNRLISQTGDTLSNTYTPANGLGPGPVPTFGFASPQQATTYDAFGNVILSVDANGDETFTYYDSVNRKIAELNPVGALTTWTYDAFSNVRSARTYGDLLALPTTLGGAPPSPSWSNYYNYREEDYSYDKKNEQTQIVIQLGVSTQTLSRGEYIDGEYYYTTYNSLYSIKNYDADGNVWYSQDYNGVITLNVYDKNNRLTDSSERGRTAWVDQTLVVQNSSRDTSYQYNSDGNVTAIIYHAGIYNLTYDPVTYRPNGVVAQDPSSVSADRITTFTYDKNGNRTSETRANVVASGVLDGGVLIGETGNATVSYSYNALGEVLSVTQAAPSIVAFAGFVTGDQTTYVYDKMGRQIDVKAPGFVDYTNAMVTPETKYYYDGLNNLAYSTVGAVGASGDALHFTQNSYVHGRLWQSVDAENNTSNYYYDANGALVETVQTRVTSDPNVQLTDYSFNFLDAAGHQSSSYTDETNLSNGSHVYGDVSANIYDAYGELVAQTVNGVTKATYGYDYAGRLTSSTADGGVQKFFIHDANGNVTMEIDDTGQGLGGMSISQVIANYLTFGTGTDVNVVNWNYNTKLTVTIKTYDADNQLLRVIQPERQIAPGQFNTITTSKTYDQFGEVATETDAAGAVTTYNYNTLGKVIQVVQPVVSVTDASGVASSVNPTLNYYYDLSGRMVATQDVNGFWTTRTLLAGSGYNGTDPTVLKLYSYPENPTRVGVDVFGNERTYTDQLGRVETRTYDKLNRLVTVTEPADAGSTALTTTYTYDSLGQRIKQSNSQLTSPTAVQKTDYDLEGRVVRQTDAMGHATTYSYAINTSLVTPGTGTFAGWTLGGWTVTEVNAAGLTQTTKKDVYGRTVETVDFGGYDHTFSYDSAGRLYSETIAATALYGQQRFYSTYFNTGLLSSYSNISYYVSAPSTTVFGIGETYFYDLKGNRVAEFSTYSNASGTIYLQNSVARYDALNRMTYYHDDGQGNTHPITINYEYDAAGNVRRMDTTYVDLTTNATTEQNYYYTYDSKNRVIISQGTLSGGVISAGTTGTEIGYDGAGERTSAITYVPGTSAHKETYAYTADGYLKTVTAADGAYNGGSSLASQTSYNFGTPYTAAAYTRDSLGRVTTYTETDAAGNHPLWSSTTYNDDGTVQQEVDHNYRISTGVTTTTTTNYDYNSLAGGGFTITPGGSYTGAWMGGQVTHSQSITSSSAGGANTTSDTFNHYAWGETSYLDGITTVATGGSYPTSTGFYYDAPSHLANASVGANGTSHGVNYLTNAYGQILSRIEFSGAPLALSPQEYHYIFNGMQLGDISNNGTSQTDYATAINNRNHASMGSGPFQYGAATGTNAASFGDSYAPINPTSMGAVSSGAVSTYTVQDGDSLQSIASALWGDASLWYLIADANGLSGSSPIATGVTLSIPNKVVNVHNNSSTFTVYNASKAMGALQPSVQAAAPPPTTAQHKGCGVIGQILEVVVAAVVAYVSAGTATGIAAELLKDVGIATTAGTAGAAAAAVGGAALAGAAGSIAAQTFGLATGIQSQFNWSGVAIAALSAGISKGLNINGVGGKGWEGGAIRGAASNAITQGVAVATGLQSKFDWAGVAVGGVVGGVTTALTNQNLNPFKPDGIANAAVAGVAGAIAGAATRSVLTGSDFGDNLLAALPDVIGSTIGNAIIGQIDPPSPNVGGNDLMANLTKNGVHSWAGFQTDATSLAMGLTTTPQTVTAFAGPIDKGTQGFQLAELAGLTLPPDIQIDPAAPSGPEEVYIGGATVGAPPLDDAVNRPLGPDGRPGAITEVVVTGQRITQPQISKFQYYFAKAVARNRGPNVLGHYVPAVPGTHFAGNGVNDAANRAYATAMALDIPSIKVSGRIIYPDEFIDQNLYDSKLATAMSYVLSKYYSLIGYELPSTDSGIFNYNSYRGHYDPFGNIPTSPVDRFALNHDLTEVASVVPGNRDLTADNQVMSDRTLESGAYRAAAFDVHGGDPGMVATDLEIAQFAKAAGDFQRVFPTVPIKPAPGWMTTPPRKRPL